MDPRPLAGDARGPAPLGEELGVEHDPAVGEIGDAGPERDQRATTALVLDLEQVAGAEILYRDD